MCELLVHNQYNFLLVTLAVFHFPCIFLYSIVFSSYLLLQKLNLCQALYIIGFLKIIILILTLLRKWFLKKLGPEGRLKVHCLTLSLL